MTQPMKHQRVGPASPLDQGTWQQILTAAKDLFFAKGYKGVSMKEIADAHAGFARAFDSAHLLAADASH